MKTAAVICHARFLDLAAFDETLRARGYPVRYYDAGYDAFTFDPVDTDLVVRAPRRLTCIGVMKEDFFYRLVRRTTEAGARSQGGLLHPLSVDGKPKTRVLQRDCAATTTGGM